MASTGQTPTNTSQVPVDYASFINDYYIKELNSLVAEGHSVTAFLVISSGIEFLGKAISQDNLFSSGHSNDDFNNALNTFKSLQKYSNLGLHSYQKNNHTVDDSLYAIVRCGIVHSSTPKIGITLTDGSNNLPCEVGLSDLFNDFVSACNELLNGSVPMGPGKNLKDPLCFIS
jgi:hypothetical protein